MEEEDGININLHSASAILLMVDTPNMSSRRATPRAALASIILVLGCGGTAPKAPEKADQQHATEPSAMAILEGSAPRAASGMPAVVFLEAFDQAPPAPPTKTVFVDQVGGQFFPQVQLAIVGQTVKFTNAESEMHNVEAIRVETGDTDFNVTTAPFAEPFEYVFERPGVARLTCGIHSGMLGFVIISPSPWAVIAENSGAVRIEGIPSGKYRVVVWSADEKQSWEAEIELAEGETTLLEDLKPVAAEMPESQ